MPFGAIAPADIVHLDVARQLLADQGGSPANSTTLTVRDVRRMVRNAYKARNSADMFGRMVAPRTIRMLVLFRSFIDIAKNRL